MWYTRCQNKADLTIILQIIFHLITGCIFLLCHIKNLSIQNMLIQCSVVWKKSLFWAKYIMVVKKVHFLYHAFPLKIFYIHRHKGNFPLLIRPTLYVHSNLCRNRKWLVQMHFWEWKSIITVNRLVIRGRTWGKITSCVFSFSFL